MLPGFRNNGLRMQMIQSFVTAVKENTFRIRSMRVITEMETWVWKNGRPDHMDGMHDDTLTCLSMGIFIMQYFMLRNEKTREMDMSIVKSWRVNNSYTTDNRSMKLQDKVNMKENTVFPFYSSRQMEDDRKRRLNAMLLLGGYRRQ
jgi:hypothetical protein